MDSDLNTLATLSINGAHGIFGDFGDELLFVTDITASGGNDALYVIDMATMVIKDVAPTLFNNPHNVAVLLIVLGQDQNSSLHIQHRARCQCMTLIQMGS